MTNNKERSRKMKKIMLIVTNIIAFIILICEPQEMTVKQLIIKIICLTYIYIFVKANNYFRGV